MNTKQIIFLISIILIVSKGINSQLSIISPYDLYQTAKQTFDKEGGKKLFLIFYQIK